MPALLVLAAFLVLCCLDVPIAVALGIVALAAMTVSGGEAALLNAAIVLYEGAGKFPLIAIPLFVLAGSLMNATSISRRLIGFCLSLVGFVRGGLRHGGDCFVNDLCRDFGQLRRRRGSAGLDFDSRNEGPRLSKGVGGGGDVISGLACHHHPAVDPDDPLCRAGRHVRGQIVRCRHHSWRVRRRNADGNSLWLCGAL